MTAKLIAGKVAVVPKRCAEPCFLLKWTLDVQWLFLASTFQIGWPALHGA